MYYKVFLPQAGLTNWGMEKEDPAPEDVPKWSPLTAWPHFVLSFTILIMAILAGTLACWWQLYRHKCKLQDILRCSNCINKGF